MSGFPRASFMWQSLQEIGEILGSSIWNSKRSENNHSSRFKSQPHHHHQPQSADDLVFLTVRPSKSHEDDDLEECFAESCAFLSRLQKVIFLLGFEVGILAQGSTLWLQYVVAKSIYPLALQLAFSYLWGYMLAAIALKMFFLCQGHTRLFLRELLLLSTEVHTHRRNQTRLEKNNSDDAVDDDYYDKSHFDSLGGELSEHESDGEEEIVEFRDEQDGAILEECNIEIQIYFVQGAVVGVFLSWMYVDSLMHFRTQVIYGGILLLLSLLFFMEEVRVKHQMLDRALHTDKVSTKLHFTV